jgi:hypothetical protein
MSRLVITNKKLITSNYWDERTVFKLNKDRLKRDLEQGIKVTGAYLEESPMEVIIREKRTKK